MRVYSNLKQAIIGSWESVINTGVMVEQENWQGVKAPKPMFEATDIGFRAIMPKTKTDAECQIEPNQPWADEHFGERVSGKPLNPPPSHKIWPFNKEANKEFMKDEKFDHTYPERFWPKYANEDWPLRITNKKEIKSIPIKEGIRFEYGDLWDIIEKLKNDPQTRQAYFPIWFPEDTGKEGNIRVPCSLGYHFMIRNGRLDIKYIMRSTDMLRHFQDDIYMCYLLARYVFNQLFDYDRYPLSTLGYMTFMTFSGHIFDSEVKLLEKKILKWRNQTV